MPSTTSSQTNAGPADAPEPTADPTAESGLFEVAGGVAPLSLFPLVEPPGVAAVWFEPLLFFEREVVPPALVRSRIAWPALPCFDKARRVEGSIDDEPDPAWPLGP
jgi:hypothetical protein